MKIRNLMEGVEPKLPGAMPGMQIMTPQQFVAKSGDMPGEQSDEQLDEFDIDTLNQLASHPMAGPLAAAGGAAIGGVIGKGIQKAADWYKDKKEKQAQAQSMSEGYDPVESDYQEWEDILVKDGHRMADPSGAYALELVVGHQLMSNPAEVASTIRNILTYVKQNPDVLGKAVADRTTVKDAIIDIKNKFPQQYQAAQQPQGVVEGLEQLDRIRKLSGLDEATKLPAQSREFGGDEFQDYMKRIVGTTDIDKKTGQPKLDKKGIEKYTSGKTKSDRYKMPYIHRSSVIEYLGPDGQTYDEEAVKKSLSQRPKKLLKQNEKMKHSNGDFEQFFNVGFAALTGIAVDESTGKLIIVNTCPGAGSCKVDCFAMKGGKVQFKNAWQSDGRILTYLLNDPDGFFNQLSAEISKEEQDGKKGDKKFPGGWDVTVRWHDAGDFFSPEYLDMALKMAKQHPDTKFYAYTKMAGAALAQKPANFIINWSEGAHTSQEKQVKAQDPNLDTTKNSRIVPDEIFQDLLVKNEKGNLIKGEEGQWQVQPDKLPELKQRLAKEYGISPSSILSYDEYQNKPKVGGMKYNVIVAPGEGDVSANDQNVVATLLLKH